MDISALWGPFLTFALINTFGRMVVEEWQKRRALARIRAEYEVGDFLHEVRGDGHDRAIIENCVITAIEKGRVAVRSEDREIVWTGRELEKLHLVAAIEYEAGANATNDDARAMKEFLAECEEDEKVAGGTK